jgi:hypothetical protein
MICFHPHVIGWEMTTLLGMLERANNKHILEHQMMDKAQKPRDIPGIILIVCEVTILSAVVCNCTTCSA